MSVTVSIGFKSPESQGSVLPGTIQGGIRITAHESEVTEFTAQNELNDESQRNSDQAWWYDYRGDELRASRFDFKGRYLEAILSVLAEKVRNLKTGEVGRFEQVTVDLVDSTHMLVFSYLDSTHDEIRIAFQNKRIGEKNGPAIDAAVGYPVSSEELCQEVVGCLREYIEYARRSGFDPVEWESLRELASDANELEKLVES